MRTLICSTWTWIRDFGRLYLAEGEGEGELDDVNWDVKGVRAAVTVHCGT
jgi:hypothetical protein